MIDSNTPRSRDSLTSPGSLSAARKLLAEYGDAAWLLIDQSGAIIDKPGPAIYICDVESGRTLLLETAAGALEKLSEQARVNESAYSKIQSALPILIGDVLDSRTGIHPDTRRGVILGAAFCISETRGFAITKHHGVGVQHLLVRYRNAASGSYAVTPMPMFKSHPIPAGVLNATVDHVLASELHAFPERFSVTRPTRFKETRRSILLG